MTTLAPQRAQQGHDPFPLYPPAAWFTEAPEWLEPLKKATVVTHGPEAGRFAAYVAPWDQCLLDGTDSCWTIPPSPTGYAQAEQGETMTEEGDIVRTANIGGGVNHARLAAGFREAVKHYHNTAAQVARVHYVEDEHGVLALGALWPDVTDQQIAIVRAAALSGDWRFVPHVGGYDLCGVQLVNTPGFPLIQKIARAAGLDELVLDPKGELPAVYIGGLGGPAPLEAAISEPLDIIRDIDDDCCPTCAQRAAVAAPLETRVADLEEVIAGLLEGR